MLKTTPTHTTGPFAHIGLSRDPAQNIMATPDVSGEHIKIEGHIFNAQGTPAPDAIIELWQANSHGRYKHPEDNQDKPLDPDFSGFGRAATDKEGQFSFNTIKPGQVPGRGNTLQAPHINVNVFASGLMTHVITRLYFSDEATNEADPLLSSIEDESRTMTLIAQKTATGYKFDIYLDGPNETAFFDT